MSQDDQKKRAALEALNYIHDDMIVGLGTGSTANHFIKGLGERARHGLRVKTVATSTASESLARELGIKVLDLSEVPHIDITVDGADEVDRHFRLIKGGGGALLREKIVANASSEMIVVVDASKLVDRLGLFPLPVEIIPFGHLKTCEFVMRAIEDANCDGAEWTLRQGADGNFVTDQGNFIVDCHALSIPDPEKLANALSNIPGVVEHGLFIDMCARVIVGTDTDCQILERSKS